MTSQNSDQNEKITTDYASAVESATSGLAPDENAYFSSDEDDEQDMECPCCGYEYCECSDQDLQFGDHSWCRPCNVRNPDLYCRSCDDVYCGCPHGCPTHVCHRLCRFSSEYCPVCTPCVCDNHCGRPDSDSDDPLCGKCDQEYEDCMCDVDMQPHTDENEEEKKEEDDDPGLMDLLASIGEVEGMDCSDQWMSALESLVILMYQASRADTTMDIVVALIAYIKSHTTRSISRYIVKAMKKIDNTKTPMAWDIGTIKQKWTLLKTNSIFGKIAFLISAAISLTVCEINGVKWTIAGFEMFALPAVEKQINAVTLVDAVIDVFEWTANTGYRIIEERSLEPLLFSDNRLEKFNTEYAEIVSSADAVLNGNRGEMGQFEKTVDELLVTCEYFRKSKANSSLSLWVVERYSNLQSIKERIIAKRRNTAIRFRPLGKGIVGPSGVGKSTLAKIVMRTLLEAMDFPYDVTRIISKDMFDKYDSTLTSDILGIFLDDLGNGKAQFCITSPTDVIIKFFNNMATTAVKAELASKGVVFVDFKVGVITSNHTDYSVNLYTDVPEASLSRLLHTRVQVKPRFRKPGSVALNQSHPELRGCDLTKDVWLLTIEESVLVPIAPLKQEHKFQTYIAHIDGRDIECKDLDLPTYLKVLVDYAKRHKEDQYSVMKRSSEFDEAMSCRKCFLVEKLCACASPDLRLPMNKTVEETTIEKDLDEKLPSIVASDDESSVDESTLLREVASRMRYPTPEELELEEDLKDLEDGIYLDGEEFDDIDEIRAMEPHSTEIVSDFVSNVMISALKKTASNIWTPLGSFTTLLGFKPVNKLTTKYLSDELSNTLSSSITPVMISLTPSCIYNTYAFKYCIYRWQANAALYDVRPWFKRTAALTLVGVSLAVYKDRKDWCAGSMFMGYATTLGLYGHYWARCLQYKQEYSERRDAVQVAVQTRKDASPYKQGAVAVAGIIVGLRLAKIWFDTKQPNTTEVEVQIREDEPSWFGFLKKSQLVVGKQDHVKHASTSQLVQKIQKNVGMAEITRPDGTISRTNVVIPQKGVLWMPAHCFHSGGDMTKPRHDTMRIKIFKGSTPGTVFEQAIDVRSCVFTHIDLVVVNISKCPDVPSIYQWLPTTYPEGNALAQVLVRTNAGMCEDRVNVKFGDEKHLYMNFRGGSYKTDLAVIGSCMGPVIQDGKAPVIFGFHIAGDSTKLGAMQTVLLSDHNKWLEELSAIPGNVVSAEAGMIPHAIMGKQVIAGPVHPHAEASRLKPDAAIEVLGSTQMRAKQKSNVVKSILSDAVADVFGVENKWGPPPMEPNWKCFNQTLEHIANPSLTFNPADLEDARQDWLRPLIARAGSVRDIRPLTLKESILGIDGERFVDPINMSTSMCHPIFGAKRKYFTDVVENGTLVDRVPSADILFEMDRLEKCWKAGVRAYPVWSSSLKDEPVLKTKDKVRVFQGSPVALTILMRKYFLKISRFIGCNPVLAECAVGVNAFGPDWSRLMRHATKYDNHVGWDYKKYDLRMTSQMTLAAYLCLIDLAAAHGYHKDDLYIMKMMLYDIVHPLLDFNGSLLQAFNMNTSGNCMTVIVNSICGSLYARLGFLSLYPGVDFRSAVAALTYGDDFKGTVKSEFDKFHFISFMNFLEEYGVTITHPDKSSTQIEYLDEKSADFLKREDYFIPEIGTSVGKLCEDSIYKSTHQNLKSTVATPREVAVSVVESATHEWFAHGRTVYEDRVAKMREVCRRVNLPVPVLDMSFDDRVEYWKEKYLI